MVRFYFSFFIHFRSISTSSPDSLEVLTDQDLIPQAPPCSLLDLSLLHHQPIEIQPYESRSNQILSAKGTLKSTKKKGHSKQQAKEEYHFFLNETDFNQESIDDSVSLVSQEDFAGVKDHTCSRPADGTLTIRSHRGTISLIMPLCLQCSGKLSTITFHRFLSYFPLFAFLLKVNSHFTTQVQLS